MMNTQNTWKVPAIAALGNDGSVDVSVHAWDIEETISVPLSRFPDGVAQELRQSPGSQLIIEVSADLGATRSDHVIHEIRPLPKELGGLRRPLDEVTGHLCDDCYEAEARGDDLPFLDAAVTYEVSEENLAPGYFDCIECNDVAIGGHAVTAHFRP